MKSCGMNEKKHNCDICPRMCVASDEKTGFCGRNIVGTPSTCGMNDTPSMMVSSLAVDPIEKKPLYHFHPNRPILSVGSYGCNLCCPFCQNYHITAPEHIYESKKAGRAMTAAEIAAIAKEIPDNIGLAYTYNEPLINHGFIMDCAEKIREAGMCNVLVSNGYINYEPLKKLLPLIDAANIDLKAFSEEFYKKIGGSLDVVLNTIKATAEQCHIEVTTLVIPDENEDHIEPIAKWLASINPAIPYHISRFFPRYLYKHKQPTASETVYELCGIAKKHLINVYPGNV